MSKHPRILTLDLLRGLFILIIITDHLFRFPNLFEYISGQGKLWVSAAEGFFLISGVLVGYLQPTLSKLWRRSVLIYCISILLTLFFTLWGHTLPIDKIKGGFWDTPVSWLLISKTLTFQYVYGWADFLPYYCVFLFFSPLALRLLVKGQLIIFMALSLIFWFIFHEHNPYFAWQLIFATGLSAGYYLPIIEPNLSRHKKFLLIITLITVSISIYSVFGNHFQPLAPLVDKNSVGFLRFILSPFWFATLYLYIRPRENLINNLTLKIFTTVGQKSLLSYCLQAIVIFPLSSFIPKQSSFFINTIITGTAFLAVYFLVKYPPKLYNSIYGRKTS